MSTFLLIIAAIIGGILLLVGLGYLLDRYGVVDKVKTGVGYVQENYPTFRRWLAIGAVALGILGIVIILLLIIT
jgi:uncharacterized membrane protein